MVKHVFFMISFSHACFQVTVKVFPGVLNVSAGTGVFPDVLNMSSCTFPGAAVAQWGKRAVPQPQGRGFDPRSPH